MSCRQVQEVPLPKRPHVGVPATLQMFGVHVTL